MLLVGASARELNRGLRCLKRHLGVSGADSQACKRAGQGASHETSDLSEPPLSEEKVYVLANSLRRLAILAVHDERFLARVPSFQCVTVGRFSLEAACMNRGVPSPERIGVCNSIIPWCCAAVEILGSEHIQSGLILVGIQAMRPPSPSLAR